MPYTVVDASTIPAGHGPHPAASPYARRISEALGVTAFEVYQVELPPDAETVPHDHIDDRNDDVYAITAGDGWLVVDDEATPVEPGQFISVDMRYTRHLRAGPKRPELRRCVRRSQTLIDTVTGLVRDRIRPSSSVSNSGGNCFLALSGGITGFTPTA